METIQTIYFNMWKHGLKSLYYALAGNIHKTEEHMKICVMYSQKLNSLELLYK